MIYGIPSYRRPHCRTVRTLLDAGISPDRIFVALQTKEDIEAYKKNYPKVEYLYREADCAAGNRNTLLDAIKERPLCMMDDDILGISVYRHWDDGKTGFRKVEDIIRPIDKVYEEAKYQGCVLAGFSSTDNNIICRPKQEYSIDIIMQGGCLIFLDDSLRFNEDYKMVEDFELSLQAIYHGVHIIKANRIAFRLFRQCGIEEGGMHDRYKNGELAKYLTRLSKQYPIFKVNSKKTGGNIRWR